ncbi:MAG TPA: SPOR domain-containing protein [Candidatus Dormibacteraeota bacterium]|nr:SPOR domain-containing protein [Candidatus Dormibacteraeota bacterium]
MASGGKRGAGERVLEGKHVIGLFLLMLLFSGVFFTLGYVMGRNQYDGQVSAAMTNSPTPEHGPVTPVKSEPAPKPTARTSPAPAESDPSIPGDNSDWEFYGSSKPAKGDPHLEPVPKAPATPSAPKTVSAKGKAEPVASAPLAAKNSKPVANAPLIPNGALVLQVAALTKQDDALSIAGSLQKKHFAAYVQTPQKDKFYRVQVGPLKDKKAAEAEKKRLEGEGFKAFYVNR